METKSDRYWDPLPTVYLLLLLGFAYSCVFAPPSRRFLGAAICVVSFFVLAAIQSHVSPDATGADRLAVASPSPGHEPESQPVSGAPGDWNVRLAPSEVAYLARRCLLPHDAAPLKRQAVSLTPCLDARTLALQVYATAFLAAEVGGILRLTTVRTRTRTLFGLRTVETLYACRPGESSPYPAESLEAELSRLTRREGEVQRLLCHLLAPCPSPFLAANERVERILCGRGVLEKRCSRRMLLFTKTRVCMTPRTAEQVAARVEEVRGLLARCAETRKPLWDRLTAAITDGISGRENVDAGPAFP